MYSAKMPIESNYFKTVSPRSQSISNQNVTVEAHLYRVHVLPTHQI